MRAEKLEHYHGEAGADVTVDVKYPLEVPYNAEREAMIDSLVSQITRITNVAYQFTSQNCPDIVSTNN